MRKLINSVTRTDSNGDVITYNNIDNEKMNSITSKPHKRTTGRIPDLIITTTTTITYLDIILAFLVILGDPTECMGEAADEAIPWKNPVWT